MHTSCMCLQHSPVAQTLLRKQGAGYSLAGLSILTALLPFFLFLSVILTAAPQHVQKGITLVRRTPLLTATLSICLIIILVQQ